MAARSPRWSQEELLVVFRLYHRTPFGRLHSKNEDIEAIAALIGRSAGAVAMKACNFASLDPVQQAKGTQGLANCSRADRELWEAFEENSDRVASLAEEAYLNLQRPESTPDDTALELPVGPTEAEVVRRQRLVQSFFRSAVLNSYGTQCALSDIAIPELLNASHIIPWSESVERRANPTNGLCLNALYDRAFDRGLISFDDDYRVMVSPVLETEHPGALHQGVLLDLKGRSLRLPERAMPDPEALAYHRLHRFKHSA